MDRVKWIDTQPETRLILSYIRLVCEFHEPRGNIAVHYLVAIHLRPGVRCREESRCAGAVLHAALRDRPTREGWSCLFVGNAQAFNTSRHPTVLKILGSLLDGVPRVKTFEVVSSTVKEFSLHGRETRSSLTPIGSETLGDGSQEAAV